MKKFVLVLFLIGLVASTGLTASKVEEYEMQERCEKKASEFFAQNFNDPPNSYINHYNAKLNKCFILVTGRGEKGTYREYLYDVNENKMYGDVLVYATSTSEYCFFAVNGVDRGWILKARRCNSVAEWDVLAKPYMEE